jgi:hypothetical protein
MLLSDTFDGDRGPFEYRAFIDAGVWLDLRPTSYSPAARRSVSFAR